MSTEHAQILVVDDDEGARSLLSRLLAPRGHEILCAPDGQQALQILQGSTPPDLVLLDLRMPGLDGMDVLRAIRKNARTEHLPVIMVSGVTDSESAVHAFELGANDYITKPFEAPLLLARVQAQLRGYFAKHPRPARPQTSQSSAQNPGIVIAGQYRVEERIGEGGFGAVFRAVRLSDQRPVAVKVLQTTVMPSQKALTRFQIEGITTRRVQHPNAVAVLDSGVTSEGLAFLVMELLTGIPLDKLLKDGPLSAKRASQIAASVCDVLVFAHQAKIIHRDIKPSNIFLHRDKELEIPKVLDFGLAKIVDESFGENFTREGHVLGTVSYVAPERLRGKPYNGRSDIYSLGATLYELTVGVPPFTTPTPDPAAVAMMHLNAEATPPRKYQPNLPPSLDALIMEMLAKDPQQRPPLEEIARRLRPIANGPELAPAPRPEPQSKIATNKEQNGLGGTMVLTEVYEETSKAEPTPDPERAEPESGMLELGESQVLSLLGKDAETPPPGAARIPVLPKPATSEESVVELGESSFLAVIPEAAPVPATPSPAANNTGSTLKPPPPSPATKAGFPPAASANKAPAPSAPPTTKPLSPLGAKAPFSPPKPSAPNASAQPPVPSTVKTSPQPIAPARPLSTPAAPVAKPPSPLGTKPALSPIPPKPGPLPTGGATLPPLKSAAPAKEPAEAPKPEAAKPEAAKPEAAKPEVPKPGAPLAAKPAGLSSIPSSKPGLSTPPKPTGPAATLPPKPGSLSAPGPKPLTPLTPKPAGAPAPGAPKPLSPPNKPAEPASKPSDPPKDP